MNNTISLFKKIYWVVLSLFVVGAMAEEAKTIRLGHFPNVTHAQAVYAHATGDFEKQLGVPIQWSTFTAGPQAIEALFADAIDATYIGPNPAITGYLKSEGQSLRIVAGAASGGAALVVRTDAGIRTEKDFAGKKIATPQLGGTQDVATRVWLYEKGLKLKERGGDVSIIPLANPDQLMLFQKKELDAAWTVEPWVSRLVLQGGGRVFLEEKDLWKGGRYVTTHLIVAKKFLDANRGLVKKLIAAHVAVTEKINQDPKAAAVIFNREIGKETGKELPAEVVDSALKRVEFTWDPVASSLHKNALDAHKSGFYPKEPDISKIYDLTLLNEVLKERGKPIVEQ